MTRDGNEGRQAAVALTIAGSDSSGGAGLQADLKTFTVHGVYGASVVTALTAQNTCGVEGVMAIPAGFVADQLASVVSDLDVKATKTGMLANADVIEAVAGSEYLERAGRLVIDPVMVATSGDRLLEREAVEVFRNKLIARAVLVTPNIAEAAILSGETPATCEAEMEAQGRAILNLGCGAVLMKGGHSGSDDAVDLLISRDGVRRFSTPRIDTRHTHGSGCTLSAAIVAHLALDFELDAAIGKAKAFVFEAIASAAQSPVGRGASPLDHLVGVAKR